jgi:hypothetical protein
MQAKIAADVTAIGVDMGKKSFLLVGLDARGAVVMRLKQSRAQNRREAGQL